MTAISHLRIGQAVKFFRTHDKQHPLQGTIVGLQKNGAMVRIKTEAGAGSVSRVEEAHCDDVTVVGGASGTAAAGVKAEWDEAKPKDEPKAS